VCESLHFADDVVVPISEVMRGQPLILPQNDSRILRFIKQKQLVREPSPEKLPYKLERPELPDQSMGQGQFVRKLFRNKVSFELWERFSKRILRKDECV
jgi:hypothetical protein